MGINKLISSYDFMKTSPICLIYPQIKGSAQEKNYCGQLIVGEVLTSPKSTFRTKTWNSNGTQIMVIEVRGPQGFGLRFDAETGRLITFLEP